MGAGGRQSRVEGRTPGSPGRRLGAGHPWGRGGEAPGLRVAAFPGVGPPAPLTWLPARRPVSRVSGVAVTRAQVARGPFSSLALAPGLGNPVFWPPLPGSRSARLGYSEIGPPGARRPEEGGSHPTPERRQRPTPARAGGQALRRARSSLCPWATRFNTVALSPSSCTGCKTNFCRCPPRPPPAAPPDL